MDAKKKQTIGEILGLYKHSLPDLAAWIKRVAPNMQTSSERAFNDGMNAFLGAALGREPAPKKTTPIPQPAEGDTLGRDLWLFLGYAGITLEDLADFVSESLAELKQAEQDHSKTISDMLHALPTEATGAAEIFETNARLKAEGAAFDMSAFLSGLRSGY